MTVRFVLENSPHPQPASEISFKEGQLVIGRDNDADWQLHDPDMYLSRRHCIVTEEDGTYFITDASSGGVFIDNSTDPVGTGNTVPIEPGMRLRLADFVLRVEMAGNEAVAARVAEPSKTPDSPFNFGTPSAPEPLVSRPDTLPDPFRIQRDDRRKDRKEDEKRPPRPLDQHDPFELDLRSGFDSKKPAEKDGIGESDFFGPSQAETDTGPAANDSGFSPAGASYFSGAPANQPTNKTRERIRGNPKPDRLSEAKPQISEPHHPNEVPLQPVPSTPAAAPRASAPVSDSALRDALFHGMRMDPAQFPTDDPVAEMHEAGRRMRELVDGLMLLLRTRAQEKQRVRVAQTIIASADVNPLKFLATTDEALSAIIQPRGQGYLPPDQAVTGAFRDLTDHQMRTWAALQAALRRMIDTFDPEIIEEEMADTGFLESLIAGGRSAKLWQLYEERFSEIAKAAEEQFLGEVGGDFRDAYENNGRS